ncbi:uncharacterized protein LOC106135131 isoform X1 [Amyelois transitella]|uniref:uncharacterized protein LOC106135131 isoform X1 n=1 Tax=Amyelois transitella TaxID=680683 RepID=UPI00067D33C1|nr:uncharacterized protein LOC106135131 isoform X1 [Amyelois transitella]
MTIERRGRCAGTREGHVPTDVMRPHSKANTHIRYTVNHELNSSFGMTIAVSNDQERTVRVTQKGLTLVVVNRLHGLLGYDVVSHSMAMTNANRELVSFSMYKKSSPSSHGHGSSHSHSHTHGHSHTSHSKVHTHGDVLTTL